eukprot:g1198.t1
MLGKVVTTLRGLVQLNRRGLRSVGRRAYPKTSANGTQALFIKREAEREHLAVFYPNPSANGMQILFIKREAEEHLAFCIWQRRPGLAGQDLKALPS